MMVCRNLKKSAWVLDTKAVQVRYFLITEPHQILLNWWRNRVKLQRSTRSDYVFTLSDKRKCYLHIKQRSYSYYLRHSPIKKVLQKPWWHLLWIRGLSRNSHANKQDAKIDVTTPNTVVGHVFLLLCPETEHHSTEPWDLSLKSTRPIQQSSQLLLGT